VRTGASLGLIGAGLAAVIVFMNARTPGGPLSSPGRITVETHNEIGGTGTWGVVLPTFDGDASIVLESVEPAQSPTGLSVLGIDASDPRVKSVGTMETYPPEGTDARTVQGTEMSPLGGPNPFVQILIGYRLDGAAEGTIKSLLIRYQYKGQRYETVFNAELVVRTSD
jgi:hypothetical protein